MLASCPPLCENDEKKTVFVLILLMAVRSAKHIFLIAHFNI